MKHKLASQLMLFLIISSVFIIVLPTKHATAGSSSFQTREVSKAVQLTSSNFYDRNPTFLQAQNGTYWLFYTEGETDPTTPDYNPDGDTYDIYYMISSDNGISWSTPSLLGLSDPWPSERDVAAFQSGNGTIWVFSASGSGPGSDDVIRYYTYNGSIWKGPTLVTSGGSNVTGGHIDVLEDGAGKIWIFYENSTLIYCVNYNGTVWSSPVQISETGKHGGLPKAMIDASAVFNVVWCGWTEGGIYHSTSSDGISWSTPQLILTSSFVSCDPTLVQDSNGTYWLFWAPWDSATDSQWLEVVYSLDGSTWSNSTHVTSGGYEGNCWWDMWPEAQQDLDGDILLFYTSEIASGSYVKGDGNIWMFEVEWDLSNYHYEFIQTAIDASSSNDTIKVHAGTYAENVFINKSLTIQAAEATPLTVLDAGGGYGFEVAVSNVTITGFRITNAYRGILIHGSTSNVKILNNIVVNLSGSWAQGIQVLGGVSSLEVKENIISLGMMGATNTHAIELDSGTYVGTVISDNELNGTHHGLSLLDVHGLPENEVVVSNNYVHDIDMLEDQTKIHGGMWLDSCSYVKVINNTLTHNGHGISLNSHTSSGTLEHNLIMGNIIEDNWMTGIAVGGQDEMGDPLQLNWGLENSFLFNNIVDNGVGATQPPYNAPNPLGAVLITNSTGVIVNACYNWWGNATGPYHNLTNPSGTGNAVGDGIEYMPWLIEPYPPAVPAPELYADSVTIEGPSYGKTFTINVTLANVTNLYGFEFKLYWNTTLLDLVNIDANIPWPSYYPGKNETNESLGRYWVALSALNETVPTFNGSIILTTLTFQITYVPMYPENVSCLFDLKDTVLGDPDGEPIIHIVYDGEYRCNAAKTKIQVLPAVSETKAKNQLFILSITLSNAANIDTFEFELHYNTSLLDAEDLSITSFQDRTYKVSKRIIDDTQGLVTLRIESIDPSLQVNESLELANITFKTIYVVQWPKPSIESYFSFGFTELITDTEVTVPHDQIDGLYRYRPVPGDLDSNGSVNIIDLAIVAKAYGTVPGDAKWNQLADLNDDNIINILDLIRVARNYGRTD